MDMSEVLRSIESMNNIDHLDPNVYNFDTLRMFRDKMQPTEEDVKRPLIDEQLKEICIKVKCRVDAYRWNPVYDYKSYLEENGRFVGKSPKEQRRLVAKAVNRHINTMEYNQDAIRKTRQKEWVLQKKDNLLSLDFWAYQREKMKNNEPEKPPVATDTEVVTDQNNLSLQQQSPSVEDLERQSAEEEMKELCIKRKSRVDVYRLNPGNHLKRYVKKNLSGHRRKNWMTYLE